MRIIEGRAQQADVLLAETLSRLDDPRSRAEAVSSRAGILVVSAAIG
ncbi:hypothetical protein [Microbacterium sp. zg-YB36]|nr:hypothetical protein [Microbacterium sp. zg-YB36]